jgi:glyoxylase-like metal-dependent hydrolase (beta-lactamase superfamily II)
VADFIRQGGTIDARPALSPGVDGAGHLDRASGPLVSFVSYYERDIAYTYRMIPAHNSSGTYEVYAMRYATRASTKAQEYFRYDVYGLPDEPQTMDYYFWVVRNPDRTVLVDCGFDRERGRAKNRIQETDPAGLLARMGIAPADVDHVVISHMHFDHVGNLNLFPRATFSITREEYEFWTGPYGGRELMRSIVDPRDVEAVQDLERQGRLHLISGAEEIFPGVVVTPVGGHAPGLAIVEVAAATGQIVLATDAVHYYEALDRDHPIKLFADLGAVYRAYDLLRRLGARPGSTVIPGHDPRVGAEFRSARPNCIDLTARSSEGSESEPAPRRSNRGKRRSLPPEKKGIT